MFALHFHPPTKAFCLTLSRIEDLVEAAVTTTAVEVVVDTATATTTAEIVVVMVEDVVTTTALLAPTATLLPAMTVTEIVVVEVVAMAVVATIVRLADLLQRALGMMPLLHVMLHASLHHPAATTVSHAVTTKDFTAQVD